MEPRIELTASFDVADVVERAKAKGYGTLGEAFEDLLADAYAEYEAAHLMPLGLLAALLWQQGRE